MQTWKIGSLEIRATGPAVQLAKLGQLLRVGFGPAPGAARGKRPRRAARGRTWTPPASPAGRRAARLLRAWTAHLTGEQHRADRTARGYRLDLRNFLAHLEAGGGLGRFPAKVRPKDIREWIAELARAKTPRHTIARRFSGVCAFFDWRYKVGELARNPAAAVRKPREAGQHLPAVLSVGEAGRLISAVKGRNLAELRDRVVIEGLYATGARVGEWAAVDVADLNLRGGLVKLCAENIRRERLAPLGRALVRTIGRYLTARASAGLPLEGALLLNGGRGRLSVRGLRRIVADYGVRAGLGPGLHPHCLRHSAASHMLDAGASLEHVRRFLGHESITSTAVYTHLTPESLKRIHTAALPRA